MLLSMCPRMLGATLASQQAMFPDYDALRSHIIMLAHNNAPGGSAAMDVGSLDDIAAAVDVASPDDAVHPDDLAEDTPTFALVSGKVVPVRKGGGKGGKGGGGKGGYAKSDRECYACGRIGHERSTCRASRHVNGGPLKPHPREKRPVHNLEEDHEGNHYCGCAASARIEVYIMT